MGASSSRSSKVQLGHGITLVQLSSSLPHWNSPLPHLSSIHNSKDKTQITLACLYTRTHACTQSTSTCFHALVRAAVLWAQAQNPKKLWHMYSEIYVQVTHPGRWLLKWGCSGAERIVCMRLWPLLVAKVLQI